MTDPCETLVHASPCEEMTTSSLAKYSLFEKKLSIHPAVAMSIKNDSFHKEFGGLHNIVLLQNLEKQCQ